MAPSSSRETSCPFAAGPAKIVPSSSEPAAPPALARRPLPLKSLNHVSVHCQDVEQSLRFYTELMGFIPIKRPTCLDYFDGAWLFNYGLGIHLLKQEEEEETGAEARGKAPSRATPKAINPRSNHVSFQCDDIDLVEGLLKEHGIPFVRQAVEENGILVHQLFFHDPDCHMIEICNCDVLPVVPIASDLQSSAAALPAAAEGASASLPCELRDCLATPCQQGIVVPGTEVQLCVGDEEQRNCTLAKASSCSSALPLRGSLDSARSSTGEDLEERNSRSLEHLKRRVEQLKTGGGCGACRQEKPLDVLQQQEGGDGALGATVFSPRSGISAPAPIISPVLAGTVHPSQRVSCPGVAQQMLSDLCGHVIGTSASAWDIPGFSNHATDPTSASQSGLSSSNGTHSAIAPVDVGHFPILEKQRQVQVPAGV